MDVFPEEPEELAVATFDHRAFPPSMLAAAKGARKVSVCLPARDEARTVGRIVAAVRSNLVERVGLVDEVVVVDDGSTDGTAEVARKEGALVVPVGGPPHSHGKGEAMSRALEAAGGELVAFLDADVENFRPHFVSGLLGPLLMSEDTYLVKGSYSRPLRSGRGGGRVTELVAKPLISLLFPVLAGIDQPLAGETALRRGALDDICLAGGYGVELALLIDVVERHGLGAVAQVELGSRVHRNRPLADLRPQAEDVLRVALERAGVRAR